MNSTVIYTENAPAPIGPYSQARRVGNQLFVSGQIPLNPKTGELVMDSIESQTEQVMKNLSAVLEAAGAEFSHVIRTTIFLKSMDDFPKVNEIYGRYFSEPFPARACVEVARLPKNVSVEIDCIAFL
ncbi:MAG: hypothetical protein CL678_05245 [Bdellovibrionaceae bacterium]|nr:hypothetical protein [Pseudobdellovibrionaceae bacterium]|tara:strand:- start:1685 stop:2065 length:381 start_codon:yes stop_codon:yes gene_type:complete